MASYVHWVEGAGARVVPLIMNETDEQLLDKVAHLNGVVLPGGGGNYYDHGQTVFEAVRKANDDG